MQSRVGTNKFYKKIDLNLQNLHSTNSIDKLHSTNLHSTNLHSANCIPQFRPANCILTTAFDKSAFDKSAFPQIRIPQICIPQIQHSGKSAFRRKSAFQICIPQNPLHSDKFGHSANPHSTSIV